MASPTLTRRTVLNTAALATTALAMPFVHGAYAAGLPIEMLGDAVVAPAMAQLGHDWESGRIDVMHEHRATLLCTGVLHEP